MDTRWDGTFAAELRSAFDWEALEAHPSSVFGLDRDGRLAYLNPAYLRFARANGGGAAIERAWGLGACYFDAVPSVVRPFYVELLSRALPPSESKTPLAHPYQCSSPDTYREFVMHVYRLPGDAGHLITNTLRIERPVELTGPANEGRDVASYLSAQGFLRQCCHCRRVAHPTASGRWDWVSALVERNHPRASHTICEICLSYYYPRA